MANARQWTNKRLREMEKHIKQIYKQSENEMRKKWNDYLLHEQARLNSLYTNYLYAPTGKKAQALKNYQNALQTYTLKNQWYHDVVAETTYRIAHVNDIAIAYVNDKVPLIYAKNYNQIDPEALLIYSNWTVVNEHTIKNLIKETLPPKKLNYKRDMAWNKRQINSSILQGILQGESIDKIANRLLPILNNNKVSALRTARTQVTRAENKGRNDRYKDYNNAGLVVNKIWIATPDSHVRDWHLSMDGQEVPYNDMFVDGLGNELEYPGDGGAPGETVYNCRCSMKSHILGVRQKDGSVLKIPYYKKSSSLHTSQIASERANRNN